MSSSCGITTRWTDLGLEERRLGSRLRIFFELHLRNQATRSNCIAFRQMPATCPSSPGGVTGQVVRLAGRSSAESVGHGPPAVKW